MQDNQDKETSADEVQTEYKRTQKTDPAGGMDVCFLCCREISDMRTEDIKVHNE